MKHCPKCGKSPISLLAWCSKLNALKIECKICLEPLKANVTTYLCLLVVVALMVAALVVSITYLGLDVKADRVAVLSLMLLPVFIGAPLTYLLGGYNQSKRDNQNIVE